MDRMAPLIRICCNSIFTRTRPEAVAEVEEARAAPSATSATTSQLCAMSRLTEITAHDPHGVISGTPSANRAMINFDTGVAAKSTTYFGYFYGVNNRKGCYTNCHGHNHNPETY